MKIFPLSGAGKVVLILIAIALGLIWSMLQWPGWWRKRFGKKEVQEPPKMTRGKDPLDGIKKL